MKQRKNRKIKGISVLFALFLFAGTTLLPVSAETGIMPIDLKTGQYDCKSAILMEADTGKILFEQNPDEALPPASVTKIMTLLLVMEAMEEGRLRPEDTVTASANACSMGGSQIFLEEGEQMSAEDMIKSVVIASANDAAVALAEHLAGSEDAFVAQMNERARELGMSNTNFENTNGLDDTVENHVTSARDIAIMSRELIRYPKITEYSSIWMDTIRNGEFGLTNTNRLVRFYRGATGLKTGSTAKAGFCISATAARDGMSLICVIMAAPSRDIRNAAATSLLDWGFANFARKNFPAEGCGNLPVTGGVCANVGISCPEYSVVVGKRDAGRIEVVDRIPDTLSAPLEKGQTIGERIYTLDGKELGRCDIVTEDAVKKMEFWDVFWSLFRVMLVSS